MLIRGYFDENVLYDIKKLIKHLKYKKDDAYERLKQRAKSNKEKEKN